jgi:GMP synthase-like glutamine amidotransferase
VANNRTLVIENDPTDDVRRLGDWLTGAGLALEVCRPHLGEPLPEALDGYAALVVMGGAQSASPGPDGSAGSAWFPALEGLLRKAVRYEVPTLAVCLGAQLLATAHAGTVERSAAGPEIGPRLVARRDAAERDALWAPVPLTPDVLQWHYDEITELPVGATLLAASTHHPHQAFRIGTRAWGVQFHPECDADMIAAWAAETGVDPEIVDACTAVLPDLEEVWKPFAVRFAAIALGTLSTGPGWELPLLPSR